MPHWSVFVIDVVAITLLVLGIFFPRYRRRDLMIAYVGLNVGVLAAATTLASSTIGTGVGFGLFAVLSIIRLRSEELAHQEIAYYFASLAIALVNGMELSPRWAAIPLSGIIVAMMFLVDHPKLFGRNRSVSMTLDRAFTDEALLIDHLEGLLGGRVQHVQLKRVDLVDDITVVNVRYKLPVGQTRHGLHPG